AVSIEPTDGTLLPGITLLDHVAGRWRLPLGGAPAGKILALDFGGQVDTLEFNSLPELATKNSANERLTREAFHLVRRGIQEKNLAILGNGTTRSARANQSILHKPLLPELEAWGRNRGSFGVIAAHSGTVLGLIYPGNRDLGKEAMQVKIDFPSIEGCWALEFAQGGVKVVKPGAGAWREFTGSQAGIRGFGLS
ncbi:MAG TPA: hypothetical protein VNU93_04000, partial [Verrucomicrobiae bacterium]|nr:hypothetical protein [Verrucomicrobiae bacterium]